MVMNQVGIRPSVRPVPRVTAVVMLLLVSMALMTARRFGPYAVSEITPWLLHGMDEYSFEFIMP